MTATRNTSRRALLAGAPAAAVALAGGTPLAAATPDPIFAVIEAHGRAAREELLWYHEMSRLEGALPREQRTWSVSFGGEGRWPPEGCTDAPDWIDAQLALGEASDRISDSMLALLTTAPTTIAGVVALLERLDAAYSPEEDVLDGADTLISAMGNWYDDRVEEAAAEFHSTLATALRNITERGQA
jgi:hypothetical protein